MAPAWKELCQHLELEEPTKLDDQVYLGIKQERVIIPQEIVDEKRKLYQEIFERKQSQDKTDEQVSEVDIEVKIPARSKKKKKSKCPQVKAKQAEMPRRFQNRSYLPTKLIDQR